MTLEDINQRVREAQQTAKEDPSAAIKQNIALFLDVIRRDEVYIVPEKDATEDSISKLRFRPYTATVQENDARRFIRIFSHEEAARFFSSTASSGRVVKIDGVESMQLAKFYFLQGDYGYLLNDGQIWATISFPDFLSGCFYDILEDPSLLREEFVTLVQYINMVRQSGFYRTEFAQQIISEDAVSSSLILVERESKDLCDCANLDFEPLTIDALLQLAGALPAAHIDLRAGKLQIKVSSAMLSAAIRATGLESKCSDMDFHVDTLALDFCTEDLEPSNPAVGSPSPTVSELKENTHPVNQGSGVSQHLLSLRDTVNHGLRIIRKAASKRSSSTANEDTDKDISKKKPHIPIPSPTAMKKGFIFAAILIIIVFIVSTSLKKSPVETLESSVHVGDYTSIYELYNSAIKDDISNREICLPIMAQDLQRQLEAYAADECAAADLAEIIAAYQKIPAMEEICSRIHRQASLLEQSKAAYQNGLITTSIFSRLEMWRDVIDTDVGSRASMAANLEANATVYKAAAFLELDSLPVKTALSKTFLLQTYYPDDSDIVNKLSQLQKIAFQQGIGTGNGTEGIVPIEGEGMWSYPIRVNSIKTNTSRIDGTTDLYISWTNTSGRTISKIYFTAIPLSAVGMPLSTTVDTGDGLYSKYIAAMDGAANPFQNGYTLSGDSYWKAAWVNHAIVSAKIVEINIVFEGTDVPITIADEEIISALSQAA